VVCGADRGANAAQVRPHGPNEPVRNPRLVLYPFLAAVYPVVALAAGNPGEVPGWWVLRWPICISLIACLVLWILFGFFLRDPDRRAFATLMGVTVFACYGYVVMAMRDLPSVAGYADSALPLLILVGYLTAVTYLVFRLQPNLRPLRRFLNTFTAILVGWNCLGLLRQTFNTNDLQAQAKQPSSSAVPKTSPPPGGPDIYLIVLDKYTGSRSLKSNFEFDNSEFEAFLTSRGFVLPKAAQANYIYTILSLATLLNYRYLDDLSSQRHAQGRNKNRLNHLIEDSAVWRFLKARNYRFIFFPTGFPFTAGNRFADLQLPHPRQIPSEFEIVWRWTTLLDPALAWLCPRANCARTPMPFANDPKHLEWQFDQLTQLPKLSRPTQPLFVFAHLTVPHEPYVFRADCEPRPPMGASFGIVQDDSPEKQAYTAQISCLNRRLRSVVDHLLKDSPRSPIILLQSDHGHGRMPLHIPDLELVTPDRIAERMDIFAAYYLPGASKEIIYDSITPVNVFRTVFRQYFQSDLAPLPDVSYWSPWSNIFQLTKVSHAHRGTE